MLARRIDEAPDFFASALVSFASELTGAVVSARVRSLKLIRIVHPSEQDTGPSSRFKAPAASRELALGETVAAARSPAEQSEAATASQLLLAVKIVHEELGEKTALFLGCTVAARVGGLSSEWTVKALALLLLEAVSDLAKGSAYAASKIDVGLARFNFHWPSLLSVALVGGASWSLLLGAISINCLIGDDIASTFG